MGTSHPLSVGSNNHAITANPNSTGAAYADIAARDADTAFQITSNINKLVRVDSPLGYFILTSIGPVVWVEMGVLDPVDTFLELLDTPASYSGFALNAVRVNAGETALEFTTDDAGNVIGPGSSTDNALVRFDLATGKIIQNSVAILNDIGELSDLTRLSVVGQTILGAVTGDAVALLDLISTTQGFYPMRMTTTQRDAISSPPIGLQIDNITTNALERFDGAVWQNMASSGDVFGPGASVDTSVATYSGVTGKLIQDPASMFLAGGVANIWDGSTGGSGQLTIGTATPVAGASLTIENPTALICGAFVGGSGKWQIETVSGVVRFGSAFPTATAIMTNNIVRTQWDSTDARMRIFVGISTKKTNVADADYTLLSSDYRIAITSITTARTITIPTAEISKGSATEAREWAFKDESGGITGANTVTIATEGAETIDGASSLVIKTGFADFKLYADGSNVFVEAA